jgi:hypothetical protein
MPKTITAAIVTGRKREDTHYDQWHDIRKKLIERQIQSKHLNGELGALLVSCLSSSAEVHVDYQLRALVLGTRIPDRVIIVDRTFENPSSNLDYIDFDNKLRGVVVPPMISETELSAHPSSAMGGVIFKRKTDVSMMNADKNTALALCETDYLIMLDDCCLPGLGLVQAAYEACSAGRVLFIGHQKLFLERDGIEANASNWAVDRQVVTPDDARSMRRVFGVFAIPLNYLLDLNGFNTELDGLPVGSDEELMERMDRYARASEIEYVLDPRARTYEIGHSSPWTEDVDRDWKAFCPAGWQWRAPGPNLRQIREELGIKIGGDFFEVEEPEDDLEEEEEIIDE